MTEADQSPVIGKHILDTLSVGMYSNRLDIYREYIQNSTDSIDNAKRIGLNPSDGFKIVITIDKENRTISIRDNGTGIPMMESKSRLLDIGNSKKDFETDRGFRGIGRLAALGFTKMLEFRMSYQGESFETILKLDGERFLSLINPHRLTSDLENLTTQTAAGVMDQVHSLEKKSAKIDDHYFEVILRGIREGYDDILDEESVRKYISIVAPVGFDHQRFVPFAKKIDDFYQKNSITIQNYDIRFDNRNHSIYKPYTKTIQTGKTVKTKSKDLVKDVKLLYQEADDGKPLYIGWMAITDFAGQISDDSMQGIRLRKKNILIGGATTFAKFFPSEGEAANKMFAGEIHVLHPDVVPNAKRDDFEQNETFMKLRRHLSKWADDLNRSYRRGTSQATSSERKIKEELEKYQGIIDEITTDGVTSDVKRDELSKRLELSKSNLVRYNQVLETAERKAPSLDEERKSSLQGTKEEVKSVLKKYTQVSQAIINSDYSSKYALPSSYNKDERRVFTKVLEVVDQFFINDAKTGTAFKDSLMATFRKQSKK